MSMERLKREDPERGTSAVMLVIVAPALLFMVMFLAQVMIAGHVRHLLSNAAAAGVAQSATFDGTAADGHQHADLLLADASGWVLSPTVESTRSATEATVTVTAQVFRIVPFGDWSIEVQRTAPVEVLVE